MNIINVLLAFAVIADYFTHLIDRSSWWLAGSTGNSKNIPPCITLLTYNTTGGHYVRLLCYLSLSLLERSNLRMNLYTGGPNKNAARMIISNISLHPMAKTGWQASILDHKMNMPVICFFLIISISSSISRTRRTLIFRIRLCN